MKKAIALFLCLIMGLSMIACADSGSAAGSAEEITYTVGICQLVQHVALDAATQGFKDALTDALGDSVTFIEQDANGEYTNCTTICNQFVAEKVDLIMAIIATQDTLVRDSLAFGDSLAYMNDTMDIPLAIVESLAKEELPEQEETIVAPEAMQDTDRKSVV